MQITRKLIVDSPNYDISTIYEAVGLKDSKDATPRMFIEGVYMQHSVKNKNGRKYLAEEMRNEVNRYLKESVETGSAVGELGHCVPSNYNILTEDGWKELKDIKTDEKVATLNSEQTIEYQTINEKILNEYSGKMLHFTGRHIDKLVTPNHNFYLKDRYGKYEFVTAQEIYNNRKKYNKHSLPKSGNWVGNGLDTFTLPGLPDTKKIKNYKNDVRNDLNIDMKTFASFMGLYLAEGHCNNGVGRSMRYGVFISQKKPQWIEPIKSLLDQFPNEIKWNDYITKDGCHCFGTNDKRLWTYVHKLGNCYEKYIPKELKNIDSKYLEELFYWFNVGDGRFGETEQYEHRNVFTTSKQLINDLQEVLFKYGKSGNINIVIPKKDVYIKGWLIEAKNCQPLYVLNVSTTDGIYLDERFLKIEEQDYSGQVGCVNVKNSNWYCRDNNNKTYWTGNSSVPEIDLNKVCHRIISLKEEGHSFIGKSMVTSSPSGKILEHLIQDGVRIGMSTKALGQIDESSNDGNVVRNFLLIGVDSVHDPSATDAFVNGILENKEFIIATNGKIAEKAYETLEKDLLKYPSQYRDQINEHVESAIKRFLDSL